ncbi:MAG: hypothetical protein FJ148_27685 [Deltaproteobacteria bacterium]|nr:hypothetical protein [Deltaproteobacteria bacterium]
MPRQTRQAQPCCERRVAHERLIGLFHAAELEQVGDAPGVCVHRDLRIARAPGELELLVGERETLQRTPRLPERQVPRTDRGGEETRIAERTRLRQPLLAAGEAPHPVGEVQLPRQRR